MNPFATVVAQTQLEELRAAAAQQRLVRTTRSARPSRIASAIGSVKSAFTKPADGTTTFLPNLTDYPYRG
jgi:hypothetical protein